MSWTEGLFAFIRWRRQRREPTAAATLVREAEEWLAGQPPRQRPDGMWPPLRGGGPPGGSSPG